MKAYLQRLGNRSHQENINTIYVLTYFGYFDIVVVINMATLCPVGHMPAVMSAHRCGIYPRIPLRLGSTYYNASLPFRSAVGSSVCRSARIAAGIHHAITCAAAPAVEVRGMSFADA